MYKNKIILILGAGEEQLPIYKICYKNKATIIGVDKNKNAVGLKYANYSIVTSIRNDKFLLKKIQKLNLNIDAAITVANDISKIYYKICKKFKIKNISKKSAEIGSNKIKLYKILKEKNFLIPNYCIIKSYKDVMLSCTSSATFATSPALLFVSS